MTHVIRPFQIMTRRSQKPKKHQQPRRSDSGEPKSDANTTSNVAYFFMGGVGLFVLIMVIIGLLGYFKIL